PFCHRRVEFGARTDAEFLINMPYVVLDRLRAEEQLCRSLFGRSACREKARDACLLCGENRQIALGSALDTFTCRVKFTCGRVSPRLGAQSVKCAERQP